MHGHAEGSNRQSRVGADLVLESGLAPWISDQLARLL